MTFTAMEASYPATALSNPLQYLSPQPIGRQIAQPLGLPQMSPYGPVTSPEDQILPQEHLVSPVTFWDKLARQGLRYGAAAARQVLDAVLSQQAPVINGPANGAQPIAAAVPQAQPIAAAVPQAQQYAAALPQGQPYAVTPAPVPAAAQIPQAVPQAMAAQQMAPAAGYAAQPQQAALAALQAAQQAVAQPAAPGAAAAYAAQPQAAQAYPMAQPQAAHVPAAAGAAV